MTEGRDHWWDDAVSDQPITAETERTDAEEIGFLVYTSGTAVNPRVS